MTEMIKILLQLEFEVASVSTIDILYYTMIQYTVTIHTTVYWFLLIYLRGCIFQPKVGYLHVRSVKRRTDIVYVEVCFLMVHSEQLLLVLAHPL